MKFNTYIRQRMVAMSVLFLSTFLVTNIAFAEVKITREDIMNQITDLSELIQKLQQQIQTTEGVPTPTFIIKYHSYKEGEIIINAVSWFKNAQDQNGHFRYEYMPFLNRIITDDHIVRQAGAFYGLGEVLVRDTDNKFEMKNIMEKSADFFINNSVTGEYNGYTFTCLLQGDDKCTLGGTSLALVGFIDLIKIHSELGKEYQNTIDGYAQYILAMKKDDAGFRNFYYRYGQQTSTESSFSNGEALLALVRYYREYPSDTIKSIIDESYTYFSTQEYDTSFYLWGMAAVKDLYNINPLEKYVDYVKDYTDWRISPYTAKRGTTRNICAYIEGVVSAYSVIEPTATVVERGRYREEIDFWLSRSADLQVKEGDTISFTYGTFAPVRTGLAEPEKAIGGFLTAPNEPVQRIDFTQHCLSSYIQKKIDIDRESF